MRKFFRKVKEWWYLYLIALVAMPLLSCYVTDLINTPRNEETISVFLASCGNDADRVRKALAEKKPPYLREINVRSYDYSDNMYSYYFGLYATENIDIVVLPISVVYSETVLSYYAPWPFESNEGEFYTPEGAKTPYGKKIRSKGDKSKNLLTYSDEKRDEDYFVFFGRDSIHLKKEWNTASLFLEVFEERA